MAYHGSLAMNTMPKGEIARTQQPTQGKLSVLLAVMLLSVALFRIVELPALSWGVFQVFGSPLGLRVGGQALLMLLVAGLIFTGTLAIVQEHPLASQRVRPLVFSLITPTMGSLVASVLLTQASTWALWLLAFIAAGIVVGGLVYLSYQSVAVEARGYTFARAVLNVVDYVAGFVLLSVILEQQGRALITAPAVALLSGLWIAELLSVTGASLKRVMLYSGAAALLEAEFVWMLAYSRLSPWGMAALLSIVVYVWVGISYQHLLERLNRRVIFEFVGVGMLMTLAVLLLAP